MVKSGEIILLINVIFNQRNAKTMIEDHHTEKFTQLKGVLQLNADVDFELQTNG